LLTLTAPETILTGGMRVPDAWSAASMACSRIANLVRFDLCPADVIRSAAVLEALF
jgi:hypothetical protein